MSDEGLTFVDTNVLVYAHDVRSGERHAIARQVLQDLWSRNQGVVSTQVLQEFYVTVTRKMPIPIDADAARDLLEEYGAWRLQVIDLEDILRACDFQRRYQVSLWDALIVTSAQKAGAIRLLTEDLQPGLRIAGLQIVNPFMADALQ